MKKNMVLEQDNLEEGREVHHPQICKGSEKILANKREAGNVHERLYGISKEKMQKNIQDMMETPTSNVSFDESKDHYADLEKQNTFAPQINKKSEMIVRDRPVQDLLYDDAMRRNEMSKQRVTQVEKEEAS